MSPYLLSSLMLCASSCVMVVAWYGHLKCSHYPLWLMILVSWGIAFFEYALQVPANRIGHQVMTAAQLRVIAEFFTLTAFSIFSIIVLKEPINGNIVISFLMIFGAVYISLFGPFK